MGNNNFSVSATKRIQYVAELAITATTTALIQLSQKGDWETIPCGVAQTTTHVDKDALGVFTVNTTGTYLINTQASVWKTVSAGLDVAAMFFRTKVVRFAGGTEFFNFFPLVMYDVKYLEPRYLMNERLDLNVNDTCEFEWVLDSSSSSSIGIGSIRINSNTPSIASSDPTNSVSSVWHLEKIDL